VATLPARTAAPYFLPSFLPYLLTYFLLAYLLPLQRLRLDFRVALLRLCVAGGLLLRHLLERTAQLRLGRIGPLGLGLRRGLGLG